MRANPDQKGPRLKLKIGAVFALIFRDRWPTVLALPIARRKNETLDDTSTLKKSSFETI